MAESSIGSCCFKPIVLICLYGFITYIKPSEPYITPFLVGEKNLTTEEVLNQIYPVWSYSYTTFLIPIFLLTDFFRYKPIIVLQGVGYIGCWILLVLASTVPLMKLMQVFYGLATACEIGYYSYIYSVVGPEEYQKSTSYVRTSTQFGLFIGSALSQILVSVAGVSYLALNYVSLANVSIGMLISLFLPWPEKSLFFYGSAKMGDDDAGGMDRNENGENTDIIESTRTDMTTSRRWKSVVVQLTQDLKRCYSNRLLLRWSIWWALSTCGWILVVNYIQNLWEDIRPSTEHESEVYNGVVEATAQICGAGAAFIVGFLHVNWTQWGEIFLGFGSLLEAGLLLIMATTSDIVICYVFYVMFIALYNFVITISQFQIAVGLSTERFALIFGMNTFLAVVLNSLLTLIFVDDAGLGLGASQQFVVYSGFFGVVAIAYFTFGIYNVCLIQRSHFSSRNNEAFEMGSTVQSSHGEGVHITSFAKGGNDGGDNGCNCGGGDDGGGD